MTRYSLDRRAAITGAAALLTASAAQGYKPRSSDGEVGRQQQLDPLIPHTIGGWRSETAETVVLGEDEAYQNDDYDQVVPRVFTSPGQPAVMVVLAYGSAQGGSLQLHRPETCYPGQGFTLSNKSDADLVLSASAAAIQATRFTARRDERIERLLFWTRIGSDYPRSSLQVYRSIVRSVAAGRIADGALTRFSVLEPRRERADALLDGFAREFVAALPPAARRILLA